MECVRTEQPGFVQGSRNPEEHMSLQAMDWALRKVRGLSPTQKLILICLGNHAGPDGTCWPSQSVISEYTELSRETIYRNLSDLEKRGLIRSIHRRDQSGRDLSKTYVLNLPKEEGSRTEPSPGETESLRGETQDLTGGAKLTRGGDAKSHPVKSRFSEHGGETQDLTGETESLREGDGESHGGETESLTSKENLSKEESVKRTKRLKTPPTPKSPTSTNSATGHASERVQKNPDSGVFGNAQEAENKTAKGDGSPSRQNTSSDEIILPEWLDPKDWNDYLEYRKGIAAPMSVVAQTRAIAELNRLRVEGHDPSRVIGQSIVNGWKGLFPVKSSKDSQTGRQRPKTFDEIRTENNKKAINEFLRKHGEPELFEKEGENNVIEI